MNCLGFSTRRLTRSPSSDGHAKLLGIGHLVQDDLAVHGAVAEGIDQRDDAVTDEVVAQEEDETLVADEVAGDLDAVGDAQGRVLLDVGDTSAEALTVANRCPDLVARVADDDADVGDACLDQVFDGPEEHRFVGDRHELLGARVGQRTQACALAAAQNQALSLRASCAWCQCPVAWCSLPMDQMYRLPCLP